MIVAYNNADDSSDDDSDGGGSVAENTNNENDTEASEPKNEGTLILAATCAPQNITYPQDINLLNEARENLESMIDQICDEYNFYKPHMYREKAREAYLALAKCRKHTGKRIRKAIGQQLQFISRDPGYVDMFVLYNNVVLNEKQYNRLCMIKELYEQQKYIRQ